MPILGGLSDFLPGLGGSAPKPPTGAKPTGPVNTDSWLERLLAATPDPSTAGDKFRYGVGPTEKYAATMAGLPGAPSKDPQDPKTERYASNYLGASKWGALPATAFNAVALGDIPDMVGGLTGLADPHPEWAARKAAGIRGALEGSGSSTSPMVRAFLAGLQQRLESQ